MGVTEIFADPPPPHFLNMIMKYFRLSVPHSHIFLNFHTLTPPGDFRPPGLKSKMEPPLSNPNKLLGISSRSAQNIKLGRELIGDGANFIM